MAGLPDCTDVPSARLPDILITNQTSRRDVPTTNGLATLLHIVTQHYRPQSRSHIVAQGQIGIRRFDPGWLANERRPRGGRAMIHIGISAMHMLAFQYVPMFCCATAPRSPVVERLPRVRLQAKPSSLTLG